VTPIRAYIRICSDSQLYIIGQVQELDGVSMNNCMRTDPSTNLVTSESLKSCLMSNGVTSACASCFASVNAAYTQCVLKCANESVADETSECYRCMRSIQNAYELTDDEMALGRVYQTCRNGFMDDSGIFQTTGSPTTTTIPPVSLQDSSAPNITRLTYTVATATLAAALPLGYLILIR
jgi:hypothetical protein